MRVCSSTVAVGVILSLKTAVGPTAEALGRTHAADSSQNEPHTTESELAVSVTVHNYATVPETTLVKSEAEAQRIFAKAGVRIRWRNCLIAGKQVDCRPRDDSLAAADVILRILPGRMVRRLAADERAGGFALLCSVNDTVCHADIFHDRAEDLARAGCADLWQILAFMAAHELGHLLLGDESHSPVGIMRPQWGPHDFQDAAQGQLIFTPPQAEQLRARLHKRVAHRSQQQDMVRIAQR
jgi:hypothetical protein